jgi:hypothetical protein
MPRKVLTPVVPDQPEDGAVAVEVMLPVRPVRRGACKTAQVGPAPNSATYPRIPRITRLVALAIKFQWMVDGGEVRDYADLARLGYVTPARITQIMNLLNLAPDIQEGLLALGDGAASYEITEHDLRRITAAVDWEEQRKTWRGMICWQKQPHE